MIPDEDPAVRSSLTATATTGCASTGGELALVSLLPLLNSLFDGLQTMKQSLISI